jgi:hypothetical protein
VSGATSLRGRPNQVANKIPLFAVKWWQLMTENENEKAKEARPLVIRQVRRRLR